ncbi:hypothetical protein JCGZ_10427 [Jatropha curcas]|uniref:Uncharacterized protein n=1 Tax=Jatropha curcas TaxID=180498 RepID=A0A067KHV6_JATCU|nr:hypothetical protein JCGZ_10427 [Jatropha curcas]
MGQTQCARQMDTWLEFGPTAGPGRFSKALSGVKLASVSSTPAWASPSGLSFTFPCLLFLELLDRMEQSSMLLNIVFNRSHKHSHRERAIFLWWRRLVEAELKENRVREEKKYMLQFHYHLVDSSRRKAGGEGVAEGGSFELRHCKAVRREEKRESGVNGVERRLAFLAWWPETKRGKGERRSRATCWCLLLLQLLRGV